MERLFRFYPSDWKVTERKRRRRRTLFVAGVTVGTVLAMDSWFAMAMASTGQDPFISLATAVLVEIPLALLMFAHASQHLGAIDRCAASNSAPPATPSTRLGHQPGHHQPVKPTTREMSQQLCSTPTIPF
jgi:hypothetical protein